MLLQGIDSILIDLRILETKIRGSLLHGVLIFLYYLIHPPLQQAYDFVDVGGIFFYAYASYAAALAATYVIVQARPEFPMQNGIASEFQVAGTDRIILSKEVQQVIHVLDRTIRPIIRALATIHPASEINLRK
jgi:hypothetical protein